MFQLCYTVLDLHQCLAKLTSSSFLLVTLEAEVAVLACRVDVAVARLVAVTAVAAPIAVVAVALDCVVSAAALAVFVAPLLVLRSRWFRRVRSFSIAPINNTIYL